MSILPPAAPDGESNPAESQSVAAQMLAKMLRQVAIYEGGAEIGSDDPALYQIVAEALLGSDWLKERERAAAEKGWERGHFYCAAEAGDARCRNPYREGGR